MYFTGSNRPDRKFASSLFRVERIASSSARRPSTSSPCARVSRIGSPAPPACADAPSFPGGGARCAPPSHSWNAVSSPASHLRKASAFAAADCVLGPPSQDEKPESAGEGASAGEEVPDSDRVDASTRTVFFWTVVTCFVPQTTQAPEAFTSPPHMRHDCTTLASAFDFACIL